MYKKAMILEIKPLYCIAITNDGSVVRLKKKEGVKEGDRIYYLPEDLYTEQALKTSGKVIPFYGAISRRALRLTSSAAAVLLAVTLLFNGILSPGLAYAATVSIDAGRGLQLDLDKNGSVIKAVSFNSAYSKEELSRFKKKPIGDVFQEVLMQPDSAGKTVIVAYAPKNGKYPELDSSIEKLTELPGGRDNILYLKGTPEDLKQSKSNGLSLGLYMAGKTVSKGELDSIQIKERSELLDYLSGQPKVMEIGEFREAIEQEMGQGEKPASTVPNTSKPSGLVPEKVKKESAGNEADGDEGLDDDEKDDEDDDGDDEKDVEKDNDKDGGDREKDGDKDRDEDDERNGEKGGKKYSSEDDNDDKDNVIKDVKKEADHGDQPEAGENLDDGDQPEAGKNLGGADQSEAGSQSDDTEQLEAKKDLEDGSKEHGTAPGNNPDGVGDKVEHSDGGRVEDDKDKGEDRGPDSDHEDGQEDHEDVDSGGQEELEED